MASRKKQKDPDDRQGSAVPAIKWNHLHEDPDVVPPPAIELELVNSARPGHQRCVQLRTEGKSWGELHGTRLPTPISAEFRIRDASLVETAS